MKQMFTVNSNYWLNEILYPYSRKMVYRYRKLVQLGLLGVGGLSVTYNIDEFETAAVGAVRFGRAAVAVSISKLQ